MLNKNKEEISMMLRNYLIDKQENNIHNDQLHVIKSIETNVLRNYLLNINKGYDKHIGFLHIYSEKRS